VAIHQYEMASPPRYNVSPMRERKGKEKGRKESVEKTAVNSDSASVISMEPRLVFRGKERKGGEKKKGDWLLEVQK